DRAVDRNARVRVRDGRDVRNHAPAAERILLPGRLGVDRAAAAAGVGPGGFGPATGVAGLVEARAAHRGHVWRGGGELDAVATVAAADGDGDAAVIVGGLVGRRAALAAAIAVADHLRAQAGGGVLGRGEIPKAGR